MSSCSRPAAQARAGGRPERRDHRGRAGLAPSTCSPTIAPPGNSLNDLLFLQRMYDAGAAPYFDIMAMQGYGLWQRPDRPAACTRV